MMISTNPYLFKWCVTLLTFELLLPYWLLVHSSSMHHQPSFWPTDFPTHSTHVDSGFVDADISFSSLSLPVMTLSFFPRVQPFHSLFHFLLPSFPVHLKKPQRTTKGFHFFLSLFSTWNIFKYCTVCTAGMFIKRDELLVLYFITIKGRKKHTVVEISIWSCDQVY